MLRRTLLARPLAAIARALPLKLSVRVEPLFPNIKLADQIHKVADAGYQGFEFGEWRAADSKQISSLASRLGLKCVCIVGNRGVNPKGMGLCDPSERQGFLEEVRASVEAAKRFETKMIVILSGFRVPGLTRYQMHDSIVEGLKQAHDVVAPHKVTMIVEPINTLAKIEPLYPKGDNHSRYYLDRTPEALEIVSKVGGPYVKVLYDVYHAQIMEGSLIETIRGNIDRIAHFHIGDVPGRGEPGTGEINYGNVFRAIRDSGFKGYCGMEYVPQKDAMTTLRDVRRMVEKL